MKITEQKNGWPVIITDFDLNTATDQEINTIGCLINHYTLVVIKNQKLEVSVQESICRRIGQTADEIFGPDKIKEVMKRIIQPGSSITARVTGAKNEKGEPGLFGFKHELKWHANQVQDKLRRSLIWLYGQSGTAGSITSFTNNVLAYNDIPEDFKNEIKDLKSVYEVNFTEDEQEMFKTRQAVSNFNPPVVYTNVGGQTGIHFSWPHLHNFVGMTHDESKPIAEKIQNFILSDERYIYDHHWTDGDLLLSEQWLGMHRRHAFEDIEKRLLYRIATDFSKIDFTKMQESLDQVSKETF
jgi:alpha-ketoglutarate-dependent taurine dioxygenase